MFDLVHVSGVQEAPYARRENKLDAELLQQMHVRSISMGVVEIRKAKKKAAPKKK